MNNMPKYKKIDWSKLPKVYAVTKSKENSISPNINDDGEHRITISAYDPENVRIYIDGAIYTGHETQHEDGHINRSITTIDMETGDYEVVLDGIVSSYRRDGTLIESHPIGSTDNQIWTK